jgi:purine nucleosidase
MTGKRFLIDTDTASDDAVALVIALNEPSIEVVAVTVVAGNVPLPQAVQNALYTAELCRSDVPVYAGLAGPRDRPLETAQFVHGEDGMGDIGLPVAGRRPAPGDAIEILIESIVGAPGEITLVTLGPLSNVAEALRREPAIATAVEHCYIMGGKGSGPGNVTSAAEYNFWADPEAARFVARSGMPLTMIGWDMSVRYATFDEAEANELRQQSLLGRFCVDIQGKVDVYARVKSGLVGFDLPDPIAMAVAIDPSIARFEQHYFEVVDGDGEDRGRDLIDWQDVSGQPKNGSITTEVDRQRFLGMLWKAARPD